MLTDGQVCILVDDMIDTGNTVAAAAQSLKDNGAAEIHVLISHGACTRADPPRSLTRAEGLFGDMDVSRLATMPIARMIVTNSNPQTEHVARSGGKLHVMDISPTLAESIRRTHNGESISLLFGEWAVGLGQY